MQEDRAVRTKYTVKLKTIVEEHKLHPLHTSADYEKAALTTADVNRPAMQLTGVYNYFDPHRLQIIGRVESTYLDTLTHEQRLDALERFMQYDIAALVICHGAAPFPECLEMADKYDRNVFITNEDTSAFQADVINSLQHYLAPRLTTHGVLVEVYGEGILLIGDSGIGKSEAAVELLKRGHRLIADDAVEIRKVSTNSLVGTAPELIRNYIELRGIGIVNVAKLFGMGAVRTENEINLIVNIVPWNTQEVYDRLGLEEQYMELLGVKVPMNTIPITPGRNLAMILEVAAMNNRQKKLGYNAALEFTEQVNQHFDENMGRNT